jgi:hypothetical protein
MRYFYLVLTLGIIALVPAPGQTGTAPFVGRWDLTMTAPDATYPSWMEVVDNGGSPQVRLQLRTGNAQPATDSKMDGSHLIVTIPSSEAGPQGTWDFTVKGGKLTGTQTTGENVAKVAGARAPALKRAPPKAWTDPAPLFNGKDLTGWEPVSHTLMSQQNPGSHWVAKDGEITNEGRGANLRTTKTFDDFKLHVEFNIPEGENSGVYLRGRYETQVANAGPGRGRGGPGGPGAPGAPGRGLGGRGGYRNPAASLGSIYGFLLFPLKDPKPAGEWQTYEITLVGRWVTIALNGFTGIDNQEIPGITGGALDSNEGAPGPIYFQGDHHGGIRYRNITISVPKR